MRTCRWRVYMRNMCSFLHCFVHRDPAHLEDAAHARLARRRELHRSAARLLLRRPAAGCRATFPRVLPLVMALWRHDKVRCLLLSVVYGHVILEI